MAKQLNKKSYLWKAYFVIDLLIFVFTQFNILQSNISLISVIYLPITILGLLAVYSFAFSKKVFNLVVWKAIFLIILVKLFVTIYRAFTMTNVIAVSLLFLIFIVIISLPELYAAYKLSFKSKK